MIQWFLDNWKDFLWMLVSMVMIQRGATIFMSSIVKIVLTTESEVTQQEIYNFGGGVLSIVVGTIMLVHKVFF